MQRVFSNYSFIVGFVLGSASYYVLAKYWWFKKYEQAEIIDPSDEKYLGISIGRDWKIEKELEIEEELVLTTATGGENVKKGGVGMSEYQEYRLEREQIDFLLERGYRITRVSENLSGAFLDFELIEGTKQEWKQLNIKTPEGRKYFSTLLFKKLH